MRQQTINTSTPEGVGACEHIGNQRCWGLWLGSERGAHVYRQAMSETAQSTEAKPQMPTNSPRCTMPFVCQAAATACKNISASAYLPLCQLLGSAAACSSGSAATQHSYIMQERLKIGKRLRLRL